MKQTQLTSDPEGTVYADTTYDELGRKATESNPYRLISEPTYGITSYQYDALGRVTKVIPPDGTSSANNVSTTYAGNCTTVTDQAGKQRRSCTDALGRLIQVEEPSVSVGGSGIPGTGFVTISGAEQSAEIETCLEFPPFTCTTNTIYDSGTVSITVAGFTKTANYGQNSTAASIASALATAFNNDAASPVTATVSGSTVNLTSKTGTAHSLSATSATYNPELFFSPSFTATPSGPTMDGSGSAPPGDLTNPMTTAYQYDLLDNLTRVDQKGGVTDTSQWRTRTFTYDSLSRLTSATNPESGTITYTYDADGNLLTKVAPKPNQTGALTVTTTYSYDGIHRLIQKSYSDGTTATVSYCYDLASCTSFATSNRIGRRLRMTDAAGESSWSYDALGRVVAERRVMYGLARYFYYGYNLDGSLATLTYPSGRVITYSPSAAGRALSAVDTANGVNYATNALYAPHGALTSLKNGVTATFAGITTSNSYNKRLQPSVLSASSAVQTVLSLSYGFDQDPGAGVINNGNVVQIANNRDPNRTQSFTYDELNRVATAQSQAASGTHCWGQSFGYDIWANLLSKTVTKCTAETLSVGVNTKNQITNTGFTYDAAGNMTNSGSGVYTYNAEGQMTVAAGVTYTYDGDGKRVKKSNGKLYWTGTGSDAMAESNLTGTLTDEYVFFDGKRIARRTVSSGAIQYYFSDHLGSASVVTSATGTILDESDYYPFGGERAIVNLDPNQYKFTGKERDTETGLDYFIARTYSSNLGRFLVPDWADKPTAVPYAELGDPQSVNLYAYAGNNPVNRADADGHESPIVNDPKAMKDFADRFSRNLERLERALSHPAVQAFIMVFTFKAGGEGGAAESGLAKAATPKAQQLAANAAKGAAGEKAVAETLKAEGKEILGTQVGVQTEQGLRRVDILTKDAAGELTNVEVKTGAATRTAAQASKDAEIATQGGTYVGKNSPENMRGETAKVPTDVRKPEQE